MAVENQTTFTYIYSASQQREVQEIRKKYLPNVNKMEELKRLDHTVQFSGIGSALTVGLIGTLLAALGISMIAGNVSGGIIAGILLAVLGIVGICAAYPIRRTSKKWARARLIPRIMQLTDELSQPVQINKTQTESNQIKNNAEL